MVSSSIAKSARDLQPRRVQVSFLNSGYFRLDGGELYAGVGRKEWVDWNLTPNGKRPVNRDNRIRLANVVVMVQVPDQPNGGSTVSLIGTGIGLRDPIFTREILEAKSNQLEKGLKREGIKPSKVDRVILPSLHHTVASNIIVQNNKGDLEPICPNAEYVISKLDYDTAMNQDGFTQSLYRNIRSDLEIIERRGLQIRLVEEESEMIGSCITMERHGGVTPGYSSVIVTTGSEKLLVSALLFPTPRHIAPEVQIGFSMNRHETYSQKEQLLFTAWQENMQVLCPMDPTHPVGYIRRDRAGRFAFDKVAEYASV